MATGLVRSALCAVLTDGEYSDEAERSKKAKDEVSQFLKILNENEKCLEQFDIFASNLMDRVDKCLCSSSAITCRSKSVKKEKIWSAFHRVRLGKIDKLWRDLFAFKDVPRLCPLVYQHVTEHLYADLIKIHFIDKLDTCCIEIPPLTTDEENILRYAAGYVPFKLLKQHEKSSSVEAVHFVECLTGMAVNGEESDLMEYTRNWTCQVNLGGLFEINDTTYLLFKEIELNVRKHLFSTLQKTSSDSVDGKRQRIISAVSNDDEVQFHWTLLSVDIESEEQAMKFRL